MVGVEFNRRSLLCVGWLLLSLGSFLSCDAQSPVVVDLINGQSVVFSATTADIVYLRIPTPYSYCSVTISGTSTVRVGAQLSKGFFNVAPLGGATPPSIFDFFGNTSTLSYTLEDDPVRPVNHYVKLSSAVSLFNITLRITPTSSPYIEIPPGGAKIINITVPTGYQTRAPIFKTLAGTLGTTTESLAFGTVPGVTYYYDAFAQNSFSQAQSFLIAVSLASSEPVVVSAPIRFNVSVEPYRPKFIRVKLPSVNTDDLITVKANVSWTGPLSSKFWFIPARSWPSALTQSNFPQITGNMNFTLTACDFDPILRESFIKVIMEDGDYTSTITTQDLETGRYGETATLSFAVEKFTATPLAPYSRVFQYDGELVRYNLSGFEDAAKSGALLTMQRGSGMSTRMIIGPNTIITADSFNCPADFSINLLRHESTPTSINRVSLPACAIWDGKTTAVSAISAVISDFSYFYSDPPVISHGPSTQVSFTARMYVVKGPAEESYYPMVMEISGTTLPTGVSSVEISTNNVGRPGCGGIASEMTQNCRFNRTFLGPCQLTLACPSEALLFQHSAFNLPNPIFFDVSIKANGTQATPLTYTTSQVSADFDLQELSAQVVPINVPSTGNFLLSLSFNASFDGPIRFLPNGCAQNDTASVPTRVISATSRTISITRSGFLVLQSKSLALRVTVAVGLDEVTCSPTASIPSVCSGKLFSNVYMLNYVPQTYATQIANAVSNFAAAFPDEYSSNSACYNGFLTELCNTVIPRCDANGTLLTGYACNARCIDVFGARGCTGSIAMALCNYQLSCTGIDWLESSYAPAPIGPPTVRAPSQPPSSPAALPPAGASVPINAPPSDSALPPAGAGVPTNAPPSESSSAPSQAPTSMSPVSPAPESAPADSASPITSSAPMDTSTPLMSSAPNAQNQPLSSVAPLAIQNPSAGNGTPSNRQNISVAAGLGPLPLFTTLAVVVQLVALLL